jgi:hypothetical protein
MTAMVPETTLIFNYQSCLLFPISGKFIVLKIFYAQVPPDFIAFRFHSSCYWQGQQQRDVVLDIRCDYIQFCTLCSSRRGKRFSLFLIMQTSCEARVPGALPGVKRPGRKADHSPPTNVEAKENTDL